MIDGEKLQTLYRARFDAERLADKHALWRVLCRSFFQRHVKGAVVVDLGAGSCEFINNIRASRKIAVDMNPDVRSCAAADVEVFQAQAESMDFLPANGVDTVFLSNFLEHMRDKAHILQVLHEVHRILRPGGRVLILQPNIRLVGGAYWDFFDHHVPLTDKSLAEAVQTAGFNVRLLIPGFLPYTTKSRFPQWGWLVRMYVSLPVAWRLFGKQTFLVGEK